ncbi:MAG: hypothetical protein AAFZ09_05870, partial [Pseudomonadota bacterium]
MTPNADGPNDIAADPQRRVLMESLFVASGDVTVAGPGFIDTQAFPTIAELDRGATRGTLTVALGTLAGLQYALTGTAVVAPLTLPGTLVLPAGGPGALAVRGALSPEPGLGAAGKGARRRRPGSPGPGRSSKGTARRRA